jgi:hypothetical protein
MLRPKLNMRIMDLMPFQMLSNLLKNEYYNRRFEEGCLHLQKGSPSTSRHLLNLVQTCKIIYIIKIQHLAKASARIEEQLPKKTLNIFERKGFSTEPEGGKIVSLQMISTKHSFQSCLPMRVLEIIAAIRIMHR